MYMYIGTTGTLKCVTKNILNKHTCIHVHACAMSYTLTHTHTHAHMHGHTHIHTHSEAKVEAFGLFLRSMKSNLSKMRVKFIDHCNQMSGRKRITLVATDGRHI